MGGHSCAIEIGADMTLARVAVTGGRTTGDNALVGRICSAGPLDLVSCAEGPAMGGTIAGRGHDYAERPIGPAAKLRIDPDQ